VSPDARRSSRPAAPTARPRRRVQSRSESKRALILHAAVLAFSEHGYRDMRVEDLARKLGIAKGSIFQHFSTKDGLFLAAWKQAVGMLSEWLEVPPEVRQQGFFGVVRYWLEKPVTNPTDDEWTAFKVILMGTYASDIRMKKDITRYLASTDPYGTRAFVRWGVERGEVRSDVDPEMIFSILEWMMERYESTLLSEHLTPHMFRRLGGEPVHTQKRIEQILELLRGAVGKR